MSGQRGCWQQSAKNGVKPVQRGEAVSLMANSTSGVSSGQLSCQSLMKARRTSAMTLLTCLTFLVVLWCSCNPENEGGAQCAVQGCPKLLCESAVLI